MLKYPSRAALGNTIFSLLLVVFMLAYFLLFSHVNDQPLSVLAQQVLAQQESQTHRDRLLVPPTPGPTGTIVPTSTIPASGISYQLAQSVSGGGTLALTEDGIPFIAFSSSEGLQLARCNSSLSCEAPTFITVSSPAEIPQNPQLILDANGIPIIAYGVYDSNTATSQIMLARCNNATTCDTPSIQNVGGDNYQNLALAVNSQGQPVIVYNTFKRAALAYVNLILCNDIYCDTYQEKEIFRGGDEHIEPLYIGLTAADIPIITFNFYDTNLQARIAFCDTPSCDSPYLTTPELGSSGGSFVNSMILDVHDNPLLIYLSQGTYRKLLRCNSYTTCDSSTSTEIGPNYMFGLSVDVDSHDVPFFSYEKLFEYDLELAVCENAQTCENPTHLVLVSEGDLYSQTMLQMNGQKPRITYFNNTTGSLLLYMGSEINLGLPTPVTPTSPPNATLGHNFFTNHSVTLSWNRVSWAIGYQIRVDDDPNFGSPVPVPSEISANTLNYTTPELPNGIYYWQVRAKQDAVNWGDWSPRQSFMVSAE